MNSSNLNSAAGDEPTIDGYGIMESWGTAWPRVIAKVWYHDSLPDDDPEKPELKKWFALLTSDKSEEVIKALTNEGFLINAFRGSHAGEMLNNHWFWKNIDIKVVRAETNDGYRQSDQYHEALKKVQQKSQQGGGEVPEAVNGWLGVEGIQTKIVLTLPPKPEKEALFGQAIADYQAAGRIYPFTCCCAC